MSLFRLRGASVGWLVALGVLGWAMMVPAVPAQALTYGNSPWVICENAKEAAEVGARYMPLEPAEGGTVQAGTSVAFSGESNYALTFSVASSSALLPGPDIDRGVGSQSGSFYTFTSTMTTATPRTIYWTASFTFTPEDCEGPSVFTTPVRTLTVVSSPTEAEPAEAEVTATKKQEEAPSTGSVSLAQSTINVQGTQAAVKLACTGTDACSGKLILTARNARGDRSRKAKSASNALTTIGSARFSISAGETTLVKLTLNAIGRALLKVDHGRLNCTLTILESSPAFSPTHTETVQLVQQIATKAKATK
jgi:hypothetical protein